MATEHYDVVIIGSGAGGGTLAHKLAPSGKRMLLLERGDYLPPRARQLGHAKRCSCGASTRPPRRGSMPTARSSRPEQNYYVGGNTKFYGAALFRLRPEDFGVITHHGGISPAWPLGYEDFEPWYGEAEQLYVVHGAAGEDPTDGPRSSDYPYPAVQHEPRIQQLHDDLERARPAPVAPADRRDARPGRATATPLHTSRCIRCDRVDGFPCLVEAKADAQIVCVDPALAHPNLDLVTNAEVERLETDAAGRQVTAVAVTLADGSEARFSGDVVVVACGALNSALLLLRSANDAHPNGLANGSDQVGRNYMRHNNVAMMALSKEPNPTRFQKTLALNDWYLKGEDTDYPWGGIQMLGKADGTQLRGKAPHFLAWAAKLTPESSARHGWRTTASTSGCRRRTSRTPTTGSASTRTARCAWPSWRRTRRGSSDCARSSSRCSPTSACTRVCTSASSTCTRRWTSRPRPTRPAPCASAPTRRRRCSTSNCKAHDLDNLYVVDSSFFPSIGAVNPTLTIIANALRVGEHLIERLG